MNRSLQITDVKKEIERLLDLYEDTYPKLVEAGKIEPEEADRRIDLLRACISILQVADLFGAANVTDTLKRMS